MKRFLFILLAGAPALFALTPPPPRSSLADKPVVPQPEMVLLGDTRPFTNKPDAGGLAIENSEESLLASSSLTLTFPDAVVTADKIDAEGSESPLTIWPPLDTDFTWHTQSEGYANIKGPLIPGQTYRFRLREGLKDLSGNALPTDTWGFEATTPALTIVEEGYGERDTLNTQPQIPLEFNYPIRLADAAQGIWIQDRATRQHYPVEVFLNHPNGEIEKGAPVNVKDKADDITEFRVRPLQNLPVGHRFDLVVDNVHDAYAGRGLSYPRVYPLGTTQPLTVDYVAARNFPLEKSRVEVKFAQVLGDDTLPKDAMSFTPAVPNLHFRKDDRTIYAEGDFDLATHYEVTVSDRIIGASGYGLAAPEKWHATFRPKLGTFLFPSQQVRERSVLGFSFAFLQVNTTALEWKLAPIPLDKLPDVLAREKEFTEVMKDENDDVVWTREGWFKYVPSEPLISALNLAPIASGTMPADSTGTEVLRQLNWKPPTPSQLEGPMLFEVTGRDLQGRVIGNRAVIYFGEAALTRKMTPDQTVIRVARQSTGEPVAGVTVAALDEKMHEQARAVTDAQGMVSWPTVQLPKCSYFLATGQGLATLQPVSFYEGSGAPSLSSRPAMRSYAFTDRPLYQPGQPVQFKGLVREEKNHVLQVPVGAAVKWTIQKDSENEVLAEGTTTVDDQGSWNGQWTPPDDASLGSFIVKVLINGQPASYRTTFQIEEFRNPPFSVICSVVDPTEPANSTITVESQYFHGAPNVGSRVKWTATWTSDSTDGYYSDEGPTRVDLYSEHAPRPSYTAEASGETALDSSGHTTLTCRAPFPDPGNRANCSVYWKVEVTGPDGQTIPGGVDETVAMDKVLLGVSGSSDDGKLDFQWDAKEAFGQAPPKGVDIQLFHVVTKSVKERLASNVYRYRNFDQYIPVEHRDGVTTEHIIFTPKDPGRYVAVLTPPPGTPGIPVSQELFLAAPGESEVPVLSDSVIDVRSNREKMDLKNSRTERPWKVGETANVTVLSPSGGIAWVSIETDQILDTFIAPIEGNTSKIEVPIKPEYEPNVFVTVYILRPGGTNKLAGEMIGGTELAVVSPTRQLDLALKTDRPEYQPREKVHGDITVTAAGAPVANADLAVYAVDDSILTLGGWELPTIIPSFFPQRTLAVTTSLALDAYVSQIQPSWLTMKGFVVGGGGEDEFSNTAFVRKQFKPLILWQPNVKTDANGVATFDCEAPDNLTRFRVIAVGQTKDSQFGAGDTTFTVSKKLMIEPSLPRYLREGDEVELRAVVRQKLSASEKLTVRCTATGSVELSGPATQEITADQNTPVVVRFKAHALSVGDGSVKFDVASTSKEGDSVQVALPVSFPVILKKESIAGALSGASFSPRDTAPAAWKAGRGTFSLAVSTTPWLTKLMGLPYILDYPHGCLEQKSSKLLGYTYLAGLLDYLPEADTRRKNYEHIIADTLSLFEANLTTDGRLPYWPGQVTPNDYVTIQSAWCVSQAEQAGLDVPETLSTTLPDTLTKMVTHHGGMNVTPTLRAFAFFVLSTFHQDSPQGVEEAASDLFLQRDKLTGEGKAMLALAMHNLSLTPESQTQLISELPTNFDNIDFNADTFSSAARTEALCTWARLVITPGKDDALLKKRLGELMESSDSLSTQENLWLLVAFNAYLKSGTLTHLSSSTLKPKPDSVSANGSAVKWNQQDLTRLADFVASGLPANGGGSYVLHADYRGAERTTALISKGMKIERVVKNLTAPARDGSTGAPFKIGDQVLISYRFSSDHQQSYVAVQDLLPAGLEVVNPDLDLFGKYYTLPDGAGSSTLGLSHSELRDQEADLYFDNLPSGSSTYSVLARATAAGTFIWPATQIMPMYDSRFFGRSPSSTCAVSSD